MYYDIRIEPIEFMYFDELKSIIERAFESRGGLYEPGVELLNMDSSVYE